MTTGESAGLLFGFGGPNPICFGRALATGAAWRAWVATLDFANRDVALTVSERSGAEIPNPKWGRGPGPRSSAINAVTALAAITPPTSSASRISGRSLNPGIAANPLACDSPMGMVA
jgi:hypothetical protein